MPHSLCNWDTVAQGRQGAWVFRSETLGSQRGKQGFQGAGREEVPWQMNLGQHCKLFIHNWMLNCGGDLYLTVSAMEL